MISQSTVGTRSERMRHAARIPTSLFGRRLAIHSSSHYTSLISPSFSPPPLPRLDYQPLFGKGARVPLPNVDRTRKSGGNRVYRSPARRNVSGRFKRLPERRWVIQCSISNFLCSYHTNKIMFRFLTWPSRLPLSSFLSQAIVGWFPGRFLGLSEYLTQSRGPSVICWGTARSPAAERQALRWPEPSNQTDMLRQRITTFSLTQILERFVASYSKRLFFFKDASAVNVKKTPKEGKICTLDLIFRGLALCNLGDRAYLAFWDMGYLSKKLTGYTEHLVGGGGGLQDMG